METAITLRGTVSGSHGQQSRSPLCGVKPPLCRVLRNTKEWVDYSNNVPCAVRAGANGHPLPVQIEVVS